MTLQNAYDEFMLEQQVRGNSAKTQEYYKGALGKFLTYAGPDFDPAAVTLKMLRNYAAQMRKGSLSSTTIQSLSGHCGPFCGGATMRSTCLLIWRKNSLCPEPKKIRFMC